MTKTATTRVNCKQFISALDKVQGPKVVVADIETFPIIAYVWGLFKQNVGTNQIHTDWSLMSACFKILNQPEVFYMDNRRQKDPRNDTALLGGVWQILNNVDYVIAHNGQRFDLPKIKARLALRGFDPLPPIHVEDTLLQNRKTFGFTSHRLAYVTDAVNDKSVKDEHKEFPGFELWRECMNNNPLAWQACEDYNIEDVVSLEESYLKLRGWYIGGINHGPYVPPPEDGSCVCPTCGGTDLRPKGTRKTKVGIYPRLLCRACGTWSRGRLMAVKSSDRRHILTN